MPDYAIVMPPGSPGVGTPPASTPGAPATAKAALSFPMLILAAVIVAAGIYVVDQIDSKAGWLLAFLVLLGVAFGYKDFGNELTGLFSGAVSQQQSAVPASDIGTGGNPLPVAPPTTVVVGPVGPITA